MSSEISAADLPAVPAPLGWKIGSPPLLRLAHPTAGLSYGIFSRLGGTSEAPFDSLNVSFSVGDPLPAVSANIALIRARLSARSLLYMNQQHGKTVHVVQGLHPEPPAADALITDRPGLALMVKQADCQGIVIWDPRRHVLAVVHCGWRGNVQNILGITVGALRHHFACRPDELQALIGPSLGPCCAEFKTYRDLFPPPFQRFMVRPDHFDLWALSRWQLETAGLDPAHIAVAGICTRCRTDLFFSYRGEGRTGRFGTAAMLNA